MNEETDGHVDHPTSSCSHNEAVLRVCQ